MKVAVLNVAVGAWHPAGQDRLAKTLWEHHPHGPGQPHRLEPLFWKENYPPGCPTHQEVPYAFKPYAFQRAIAQGYDAAIWLDASMWLAGPITPIIDDIEATGAATWLAGWNAAQWTNDRALKKLGGGMTRDEAENLPLVCGGLVGFDLRVPANRVLLARWLTYAQDGASFPGYWTNEYRECSDDPRCKGHRHDMPSLSYLCRGAGYKPLHCPRWFAYSTDKCPAHPEALVLARGM